MKTTLVLRDDLLRRAKARAALRGQPLRRYMEDSLERALQADESQSPLAGDWIRQLPAVSSGAVRELETVLGKSDFRAIDPDMWK